MAASIMISSIGLMSLVATRHRPFPDLHFTLTTRELFTIDQPLSNSQVQAKSQQDQKRSPIRDCKYS